MYAGPSNTIDERHHAFDWKLLQASASILVVSVVLLLVMGEDARAQEQVEGQYSFTTIEAVTTETWVDEWQALAEPTEVLEVEPAPVADQYDTGASAEPEPVFEYAPEPEPAPTPIPEPVPAPETPVEEQYGPDAGSAPVPILEPAPEPVPAPAPEPPGQYEPDPGTPAPVPETPVENQYGPDTGGAFPPTETPPAEPPTEEPPAQEPPVQESRPAPEPVEPVAPEENSGYPPQGVQGAEQPGAPAPEEPASQPSWTSSLGATISDATQTLSSAVAGALEALTDWSDSESTDGHLWGPVGETLTGLFLGGQPDPGTPDDVRGGDATPAPGSRSPSENSPQPFPAGAFQAFSTGGGMSTGGGVPLLLLCVLVSVALLARWEGRLSWLHFLLPRPYSAPRRALERPG